MQRNRSLWNICGWFIYCMCQDVWYGIFVRALSVARSEGWCSGHRDASGNSAILLCVIAFSDNESCLTHFKWFEVEILIWHKFQFYCLERFAINPLRTLAFHSRTLLVSMKCKHSACSLCWEQGLAALFSHKVKYWEPILDIRNTTIWRRISFETIVNSNSQSTHMSTYSLIMSFMACNQSSQPSSLFRYSSIALSAVFTRSSFDNTGTSSNVFDSIE